MALRASHALIPRAVGDPAHVGKRFARKLGDLICAHVLRPELIPTDDPKLYEVEYCVMSRSNFGGANTVPEVG